jgi:mannosyl-oligosaccharide alpha-1,2-mannosidase
VSLYLPYPTQSLSLDSNSQEFSFGGEADSTYEYLLKEFILLGGTREQYRKMYVNSVDAAHEYLFFRPLVEGDPEIMFSGKYRTRYADDGSVYDGELVPEMQHLVPLLKAVHG